MINRDSRGHLVNTHLSFSSIFKERHMLTSDSIFQQEVKFLDLEKTNYCESICQGCFH